MKKVVFSVTPFLESSFEIFGVDGEIYVLEPGRTVIIPQLNAKALEQNKIGRIVGEYQDPKLSAERAWELELEKRMDPFCLFREEFDFVKEWARMMLEAELSKPNKDLDKIIEYKMIINGINPATFLYNCKDTKKEITYNLSSHSQPKSPTGLCSPSYNTVQAQNSEEYIDDDELKWEGQKLKRAFETFGFRCVTTLQAFRIRGLDELDLRGYNILDYGYTRVELHEEFAKLLEEFGYDLERDCAITLLFEEYRCPKHGLVYKPVVDWVKKRVRERKRVRVLVGRLHPFKKYSDSKRYSAQKLEQIRVIAESARSKGIVGFRKFDGELKQVRHFESDLALLWMVFTVPDRVSEGLRDFILARPERRDVEELMRRAVRSTLRKFLRKYLQKHENVPISGDFKEGGFMNVHLWSSSDPRRAHIHVHVCIWNVILWNGKVVRFSPFLSKEWLVELRKIWSKEFFKWLNKRKFSDVKAWINPLVEEDYDSFNIYNAYTWLDAAENGELEEAGKITHHLRYNARKPIIDLNEFFYSGIKADELYRDEKDWIRFLVGYSNRTSNFGFMNNWRKAFNVPKERVLEFLERLKSERYEYCPICKSKLEYIRTVTLDEVLKSERLLVLWYFDRRMNIEVWRKGSGN